MLPCVLLLLLQGLEAELGVEEAGELSFEVSTPGAERTLILPQDLLRFKV
jgi:ribosome maturation factor RimP